MSSQAAACQLGALRGIALAQGGLPGWWGICGGFRPAKRIDERLLLFIRTVSPHDAPEPVPPPPRSPSEWHPQRLVPVSRSSSAHRLTNTAEPRACFQGSSCELLIASIAPSQVAPSWPDRCSLGTPHQSGRIATCLRSPAQMHAAACPSQTCKRTGVRYL